MYCFIFKQQNLNVLHQVINLFILNSTEEFSFHIFILIFIENCTFSIKKEIFMIAI